MQKVYSCFELNKAEELKDKLIEAGIESYIIDYSSSRGDGIGATIDQIPTVYISDMQKTCDAFEVIKNFDKSFATTKNKYLNNEHCNSRKHSKFLVFLATFLAIVALGIILN